jgi:hypothetical protein
VIVVRGSGRYSQVEPVTIVQRRIAPIGDGGVDGALDGLLHGDARPFGAVW